MFFPLRWQSNKNVLFIIPELSSIFPNGVEDSQDVDVIHPPLGVLYLSSYCKSNGYRTFVIDQMSGNYYNEEKLIDFIQFNHINIVGISCTMSAVFDESNYQKTQLVNNTLVKSGDPVYKLCTDEEWSVEQIDHDLQRWAKIYSKSPEEVQNVRDFLLGMDKIEDIETRVFGEDFQWKYWKNKKWRTIVLD